VAAIRYQGTAEPALMFKCHCRDCQRPARGGHACVVFRSVGNNSICWALDADLFVVQLSE
jgi:hypothetical protein